MNEQDRKTYMYLLSRYAQFINMDYMKKEEDFKLIEAFFSWLVKEYEDGDQDE